MRTKTNKEEQEQMKKELFEEYKRGAAKRVLEDDFQGKIDSVGNYLDIIEIGLDYSRFKKDTIKIDGTTLSKKRMRCLVDNYDQVQKIRIAMQNQQRSILQGVDGDGFDAAKIIMTQVENTEKNIVKIIEFFTDYNPVTYYLKQITGIGGLTAARLYAFLDITEAQSAGSFWTYAGLNNNVIPYLGKEKAKDIVDKYNEIARSKQEEIHGDEITKTSATRIMKAFLADVKKHVDEEGILKWDPNDNPHVCDPKDLVHWVNSSNKNSLLVSKEIGFASISTEIATMIMMKYDRKFLVPSIIDMVAVDAKVNRRPSQIINGVYGRHKFRCKKDEVFKPYFTTDDLEKYLAMPPFNARLKKACYLIGDTWNKNHNRPKSLYGRLYADRKAYETIKNERGDYADQAAKKLQDYNVTKKNVKAVYVSGKLPAGHIEMRARRYATKILLSHLYEFWYIVEYGTAPRVPYILGACEVNGEDVRMHTDYIKPEVPYEEVLEKFGLKIPDKIYPTLDDCNTGF